MATPSEVQVELRIARLNDSADGVQDLLAWARQASGVRDDEVRERVAAVVREYRVACN